nr:MAG: hypothetical protein J07AB56_09010 [Candidatus Nanosalinarum sp. J07AB56]
MTVAIMSDNIDAVRRIIQESENQERLLDTLSPVQRTVAEEALRVEE